MFTINCQVTLVASVLSMSSVINGQELRLHPIEKTTQLATGSGRAELGQTSDFVRAPAARLRFGVNGEGLTVVVLDTGLNVNHEDFLAEGKIAAKYNFTATDKTNKKQTDNVADKDGHGTNVSGIIVANGIHRGIAPGARIIPHKVLQSDTGSWTPVRDSLHWVLESIKKENNKYKIAVVNMSLSDHEPHADNIYSKDDKEIYEEISDAIVQLRSLEIPVVVAAGNGYFPKELEGMGFPAVCESTISVGALYDADVGSQRYLSMDETSTARAQSTKEGRITPFSQRLSEPRSSRLRTDIFAPGAIVESAGIGDNKASTQQGTSQAAPVVSGIILLLQEYYQRETNKRPTVDQLERWLRGGIPIIDGDDEDDVHVPDNGPEKKFHERLRIYYRVDAMLALTLAKMEIEAEQANSKQP